MSRYLNFLKQSNIELPIWFGKSLAHIPFSNRPGVGTVYRAQKEAISAYKTFNDEQKRNYIFDQFHKIFSHAYSNIPFYKDLYQQWDIHPDNITRFDDIKRVPVVSKKDLINIPLEKRSYGIKNRLLVNTGGSSGKPFFFYMDPRRYGNEWAHMHDIWSVYDYKPYSLKLGFDGRSNVKDFVSYDFVRNSLKLDIYADYENVARKLIEILSKYKIEFLHGYPSAIYEFATYCRDNNRTLQKKLRESLKAVFLSSEYPSPSYRDVIEDVFKIPTQSFYGHTETCVLAKEEEKFSYSVYQTYGYGEAITNDSEITNLIGTSYFNYASPLIRYNTDDSIDVTDQSSGILNRFKIKDGRSGDYVLDKNSKRIPLTGLIFGRHHKLFDYCSHIQIKENAPGYATIYYVPNSMLTENIDTLFDSSNIDINFNFIELEKPVLTNAGKVNLLIK